MRILYLSIIAILIFGISSVYADPVLLDGTVTEQGCNIIHGTISQITTMANTIIQACNYLDRHFKLVGESGVYVVTDSGMATDPKTGIAYSFSNYWDIPSTYDPKNSWSKSGFNENSVVGRIPVVVNDTSDFISMVFPPSLYALIVISSIAVIISTIALLRSNTSMNFFSNDSEKP